MRLPFSDRAALGSLLAAAMLAAPAAHAHEYWLIPSRYDATPGVPVTIGAAAGTGFQGEPKPWSPIQAIRLTVRAAKPLDLGRIASPGELKWARFGPSDRGGALITFESGFTPITLDAPEFDRYLAEEGLSGAIADRRAAASRGAPAPGRERYRRCAKAWLSGSDATRATTPLGLPLEIVPLSVPGAAATLPVRVLRGGRPAPGLLVKAWRSPFGADLAPQDVATRDSVGVAARCVTNARGECTIPASRSGV